MAKKGWHREPGRHSLAARGLRTSHKTGHVPIKSSRHGPRASTVKKWVDERLESFRKKLNKDWESEFFEKDNNWVVITEVGKDGAGDYVDLRTDSNAYEILYDPMTHDFGFLANKADREFFAPFRKKFPGMYFEHMGGGVLRAYLWNYHGDLAEVQASETNEAMEEKITKYEKDRAEHVKMYTGEHTRGH